MEAEHEAPERRLNVLITGARGLIGSLVYARLAAQPASYNVYGMDRHTRRSARAPTTPVTIPTARLRIADLADFPVVRRAVAGMEIVVHLAAEADSTAGWESILRNNIIGTHNLFEASRQAGVRRVIFASSNQVVFGYRDAAPDPFLHGRSGDSRRFDAIRPIDHTRPTRPLNDYACSKVYGEALAHMYAYAHGLSCLCLRVGWVTPDDALPQADAPMLWCSQRDIMHLVERCIRAPDSLRFDIFFGQSDNRANLVDIAHARQVLGYRPQDSADDRVRAEASPTPAGSEDS